MTENLTHSDIITGCELWRKGSYLEFLQLEDVRNTDFATALKLYRQYKQGVNSMPVTTDPNDPRLGHGIDTEPVPQNEIYLVLPEEDRAKGFVRPLRYTYQHIGKPKPQYPLRDLTNEEKERYTQYGYVKYEVYPESESPLTGRYWTQNQLDNMEKGCKAITTISLPIAETFACNPLFYGSTYCTACRKHLPVEEFVWVDDGTMVGS